MLIHMLGEHRGSNTGHDVTLYQKGAYLKVGEDIGDTLARMFIRNGWAVEVKEDVVNKLIASPYLNQKIA